MKILISGVCGFAGSQLAFELIQHHSIRRIIGVDNLSRRGAWTNLQPLRAAGVEVVHGDIRCASDVAACGGVDWVIDAAANPSVLAGTSQLPSSRQLVETNVSGTLNLLEHCKSHAAGFVLLSTSRVYSIANLASLPLVVEQQAFRLAPPARARASELPELPAGVSELGISESCSTAAPVSLYGSTKLAAEALALEYHHAFGFPVWINRCGVLAGAGQFGKPDQGIFAFWLHSWREQQALRYIGFEGRGHQVRDCLHCADLASLLASQLREPDKTSKPRIVNAAGGIDSARSLAQLSQWCEARWGPRTIEPELTSRTYDLPWVVLDSSLAQKSWGWRPRRSTESTLQEIADFADAHPDWISLCSD